jgi:hypothetical protein
VRVGAPIAILAMVIMWIVGQRALFRIPADERLPHLEGGLGVVRQKYEDMGPLTLGEKKALGIFGVVLFLWMTDIFHLRWFGVEITAPFAALLGAVIVLFPRWHDRSGRGGAGGVHRGVRAHARGRAGRHRCVARGGQRPDDGPSHVPGAARRIDGRHLQVHGAERLRRYHAGAGGAGDPA